MKPIHQTLLGTSVLAAGMLITMPAVAQAQGYVTDTRGVVVKDPYNLCWRSGFWTPGMATSECDPDLAPKPPPVTPAPVPAAPVKPEAPVAAPAPPPPPKPKLCNFTARLSADAAFDFGKATLKPAARAQLDKDVIERLGTCASIDVINVNGHTDRLGDATTNQKLSERRAEVVRAYLVGKGVDASKIEVYGYGKTMPIKSCPDTKDRKALIQCLADNRRVEVEVKGPGK